MGHSTLHGGVAVCSHDGTAHLSLVQFLANLPIPVATVHLNRSDSYTVAAALIAAVGKTDLLDEQLRIARAELLTEVRAALIEELALEHPEFPAEFNAGMNAGLNTAIQRVMALQAGDRS